MSTFRIVPAGESALIVEFEERIDPAINARAIACAQAVEAARVPGVLDVVPTYRSVAVYFDPLRTDGEALLARLEDAAGQTHAETRETREPVRIPVCYGGDLGPDLAGVAAFAGLPESAVVSAHCSTTYRVFMLGFVPGFAYLGSVDERIAAPRRPSPRTQVASGSVGIAALQTGVYPRQTPGGWNIIGRTPIRMLSLDSAEPSLLKAGDSVRFHPIDRAGFDRLAREQEHPG